MDRNYYADKDADWVRVSLSARRAWIEIAKRLGKIRISLVALRKESVDRNAKLVSSPLNGRQSLSARRAWIEICPLSWGWRVSLSLSARRAWIEIHLTSDCSLRLAVALRKESVDRNREINTRGRKKMESLSARRAWIEMLFNVSP